MTKRDVMKRVPEHALVQTEALDHWHWDTDKIIKRIIAKGISPKAATRKAQALEKIEPPLGWETIQTGGM